MLSHAMCGVGVGVGLQMNSQYHFQLVFLRLSLKRNVLSQSNLRITLLENRKEQEGASFALQSEEIKIKKNQRIVDLDSIKTFSFSANAQTAENRFTIKYEIKGNGEDRVRAIPVDLAKMIRDYQSLKKTVFEESFGGQNAELSFKFYLSQGQSESKINLLVTPQSKQREGDKMVRSNSISRTKRPPNLNINRISNVSPTHSPEQTGESAQKHVLKHLSNNAHPSLLAMSPISPDFGRMPHLGLNHLQSHDENASSVSGTHKKISSLPMSEIEKVNELIATHHRPHADHHQTHHLSYKLKIVIIMLIIGIAFLLFDTLSDRKLKGKKTRQEHDEHGHAHEEHHPAAHQEHHQPHQKPKQRPKKSTQSKPLTPKQQPNPKKPSAPLSKKAKKQ